jgi:KipI family sensor histidine kinase inhibitor
VAGSSAPENVPVPTIVPLGDSALLVRFGTALTDVANRSAIALTRRLDEEPIAGVVEVVPNLISVMLRYDPLVVTPATVAGELRLHLATTADTGPTGRSWTIPARFDGPDLNEVANALGMSAAAFVTAHNASALRVLATGFAPGFVYCGLHAQNLMVPRRTTVRAMVPAGSILFAAGQTAIAATQMPTGWHLIGNTEFRNFLPHRTPPTQMAAGDHVAFEIMA